MNKKLLALSLPIIISPLLGAVPKIYFFSIEVTDIGPYEKYETDSVIEVKVTNLYNDEIRGRLTVTMGDTITENIKVNEYSTKRFSAGQTLTYNVTLATSLCLGDDGMNITFSMGRFLPKTASYTADIKQKIVINPISHPQINPFDYVYEEDGYVSKNVRASIINDSISYAHDQIEFTNYSIYYSTSTYLKIPFDEYWFYKDSNSDFTYDSAYMIINGYKEYFPSLTYSENKCKIPLKLTKNGAKVELSFDGSMFVHPQLLLMSSEPKSGYVATNNFYLPVNKKSDLDSIIVRYEFNGVGLDKVDISFGVRLDAYNSLIGNCQDSEYCIIGEVSR